MIEPELEKATGIARWGPRIVALPASGALILATDLHGHYDDYLRLRDRFEKLWRERDGRAFLLLTGDLIHGPPYSREEWPDYLGDYYFDRSQDLLDDFLNLRAHVGGRLLALLGNHEHSHVGGPLTHKFGRKPSEAGWFEESVGPERMARYRELFESLPLVALTPCGVVVTHGAPRVLRSSFEEIAGASFAGFSDRSAGEMADVPVVGELLWCRTAGPLVVRRFLRTMSVGGLRHGVAVYGHDPVREGFEKVGREQLCLSTSYGLRDRAKVYLELDLEARYESTDDLRPGIEIRQLHGD